MVPKTGPRATTRAVQKGVICEQVIHGIVICGRRASAAWSRFRDQNLVLKMGPEIASRARENGHRGFNFRALGACDFVRLRGRSSPALCRPTPDPEPALRSKPRNPRRRKAVGGGVGLASAAGARARAT